MLKFRKRKDDPEAESANGLDNTAAEMRQIANEAMQFIMDKNYPECFKKACREIRTASESGLFEMNLHDSEFVDEPLLETAACDALCKSVLEDLRKRGFHGWISASRSNDERWKHTLMINWREKGA